MKLENEIEYGRGLWGDLLEDDTRPEPRSSGLGETWFSICLCRDEPRRVHHEARLRLPSHVVSISLFLTREPMELGLDGESENLDIVDGHCEIPESDVMFRTARRSVLEAAK